MINLKQEISIKKVNIPCRLLKRPECPETSTQFSQTTFDYLSNALTTVKKRPEKPFNQIEIVDCPGEEFKSFVISEKNLSVTKTNLSDTLTEGSISFSYESNSGSTQTHCLDTKKLKESDLVAREFMETPDLLSLRALSPKSSRRDAIFWRYNPTYTYAPKPAREEPELWEKEPVSQFLFRPVGATFQFGAQFEPLFCRAALYDVVGEKRVSEFAEFVLDGSEEPLGNFIFSCDPSPFVHLVVHFSRVFAKDVEKPYAPYFSEKGAVTRDAKKTLKKILHRYSDFPQEFAWSFRRLFDSYGDIYEEGKEIDCDDFSEEDSDQGDRVLKTSCFFLKRTPLHEPERIKLLQNAIKAPKTLKAFPNSAFSFELKQLNEDAFPARRLDASLRPLCAPENAFRVSGPPCVELESFPVSPDLAPAMEFVNNLYVQPLAICGGKYKNVFCEVYLRTTDCDNLNECEEAFAYGAERVVSRKTPVFYRKAPLFEVEWKAILPREVGEKTHLLFLMHQLNSERHKRVTEYIGYSFLALGARGSSRAFIPDKEYSLDFVVGSLESGYLSRRPKAKSSSFFSKSPQKVSMTLRTQLHSSVLTNKPSLDALYNLSAAEAAEKSLRTHLAELRSVSYDDVIKFLPSVIGEQMKLLAAPQEKARKLGFNALISIVKMLNDNKKNKRQKYEVAELLSIWVAFYFENHGSSLYLEISKQLNHYLETNMKIEKESQGIAGKSEVNLKAQNSEIVIFFESLFFWFKCLSKSLRLEMLQNGELNAKNSFIEELRKFNGKLIENLEVHKFGVGLTLVKKMVYELVGFLCDLQSILRPAEVLELAAECLAKMGRSEDVVVGEFKRDFMALFYDGERYLQLILGGKPARRMAVADLEKDFPHTALLITNCVASILKTPSRYRFIAVLLDILCKHDFDKRLKTNGDLAQVASAYLPFVMKVSAKKIDLSKNTSEIRDLLVCFCWVVRNCETRLLEEWWAICTECELKNFLHLLQNAMCKFSYIGRERAKLDYKTFLSQGMAKEFSVENNAETIHSIKSNIETMMSSRGTIHAEQSEKSQSKSKRYGSLKKLRVSLFKNSIRNTTQKIKKFNKRSIEKLIKAEGKMTSVVYTSALAALSVFIQRFVGNESLAELQIDLLSHCLGYTMTTTLYNSLFLLIQYYLVNCPKLFAYVRDSEIEKIAIKFFGFLLQYSINPQKEICARVGFFLYQFANLMHQNGVDLERLKKAVIVSLYSKGWTIHLKPYEIEFCCKIVKSALSYTRLERTKKPQIFGKELCEMIESTTKLLVVFGELAAMRNLKENCDQSHYEELLLQTASSYDSIPLIRINWLKKIVNHHQTNKNEIEKAECLLTLCDLITELDCSQSESREKNMVDEEERKTEVQKIEEYLVKAFQSFKKGGFLERSAAFGTERMLPVLMRTKCWNRLGLAHKQMMDIYKRLDKDQKNDVRSYFGTYFLVAFHGKQFGPMDGEQYVYRRKGIVQMGEFCEHLTKIYENLCEEKVQILQTRKNKTINSDRPLLSVFHLEPLENTADRNQFERQAYKDTYTYQIRSENDCKKVYRVKVEKSFPTLITRQKVIKISHETFSPVQVACDDVKSRVSHIYQAMNAKPVVLHNLESLLVGTLMAQVNGGIKVYFEAFYAEDRKAADSEEMAQFERTMRELVSILKKATQKYSEEVERLQMREEKEVMHSTLTEFLIRLEETVSAKLGN